MRLFLVFIFSFFSLFADESIDHYLTSEHNTLALLEDVVNIQNGKIVQINQDIHIDGPNPLSIFRYYDAGHPFEGEFGYGVGLSVPLELKFQVREKKLDAEERIGSSIPFSMKSSQGSYWGELRPKIFRAGYSNCCEALLRGEPPLYAMRISGTDKTMCVKLGDGTKRIYRQYKKVQGPAIKYRLIREEFPNRNRRHYTYLSDSSSKLKRIWTTNSKGDLELNWINFIYDKDIIRLEASNQQQVEYFKKLRSGKRLGPGDTIKIYEDLLCKTSSPHLVDAEYEYSEHTKEPGTPLFCLKRVIFPEGRFLEADYDDSKTVKRLSFSGRKNYGFHYSDHHTRVKDALGHEKEYQFVHKRLYRLSEKHRTQRFDWSDQGHLLSHTILDLYCHRKHWTRICDILNRKTKEIQNGRWWSNQTMDCSTQD